MLPQLGEEMDQKLCHPAEDVGQRCARICALTLLDIRQEFTWKPCNSGHFDQEQEDIVFHDDLVVIGRIPLAPHTACIALSRAIGSDLQRLPCSFGTDRVEWWIIWIT